MITKGPSKKQVIISMSLLNTNRVMTKLVIITNKVAATLDLNIIEKYIKNVNDVDVNNVMSPRLSQIKSYLKILDISYFIENTVLLITSDIVESVIKSTHIFNNTVLVSCTWVIKASPQLNMIVIWINI